MLLELKNISKTFSGIQALKDVSFAIHAGEVHAVCGENGAGKSTLMNILSGNLHPTSGNICIDGMAVELNDTLQARQHGINIVHQERSLFDELSIAENIFAGQQPVNKAGLISYKKLHTQTKALLARLHLDFLNPSTPVKQLSAAHKQMVEIAKALAKNPSVLILDEPTASITQKETAVLFTIIKDLQTKGVTIIYISHRLQEIFEIADTVTVLKDGAYIGSKNIKDTTADELIRMMVGRDIKALNKTDHSTAKVLLEVNNISGKGFTDVSFKVHSGEIAALAGLSGAGRTEIARAIFGADNYKTGTITIHNKKLIIRNTYDAIAAGIGYVPEERKTQGLFMEMNIEENIIATSYIAANATWFSKHETRSVAKNSMQQLRVVAKSAKQQVKNLSGGNQQKVVLARWLLRDADVLIVDEPTHGIDVGAKFEVYELLQQLAAKGKAILLITSELPELLMLSDTIYVLYKGFIKKKFSAAEATEEKVLHYASGLN